MESARSKRYIAMRRPPSAAVERVNLSASMDPCFLNTDTGHLELNFAACVLNALWWSISRTAKMPLSKFAKRKRKPRVKRSVRSAYLQSAREAFARAAEAQYGTVGPAPGVRRSTL